ncbi:MAG: hypothetical protein JSS65_04765 [Armatimonadetes bacterium]|nr:hypothetical protein [Armatimonadota bacterium]
MLETAINAEFGNRKAFIQKLGAGAPRLSQILGSDTVPGPSLLARIIECFDSLLLQDQIYDSWLKQVNVLPAASLEDVGSENALWQLHSLGLEGDPARALELADAWSKETPDRRLRHQLYRQKAEIALRLTKVSKAAQAVLDIADLAKEHDEESELYVAIWLRGMIVDRLDGIPLKTVIEVHEEVTGYVTARPAGVAPDDWSKQVAILQRDRARRLLGLAERRSDNLKVELLDQATKLIQQSLEMVNDEVFLPYGLEVRARIEAEQGQYFKAEETLTELEEIGMPEGSELWEKSQITVAKIKAHRKEFDEAVQILDKVSEQCFARMNLYHHRKADQFLARLLLGLESR